MSRLQCAARAIVPPDVADHTSDVFSHGTQKIGSECTYDTRDNWAKARAQHCPPHATNCDPGGLTIAFRLLLEGRGVLVGVVCLARTCYNRGNTGYQWNPPRQCTDSRSLTAALWTEKRGGGPCQSRTLVEHTEHLHQTSSPQNQATHSRYHHAEAFDDCTEDIGGFGREGSPVSVNRRQPFAYRK